MVDSLTDEFLTDKTLKTYPDKSALISLPRYDKFTNSIRFLSRNGINLKEVAGNNSAILLSVVTPSVVDCKFDNTHIVFTQPFASKPTVKRTVLATPISNLCRLVRELDSQFMTIEHIYDY